jgi:hypothetical protein
MPPTIYEYFDPSSQASYDAAFEQLFFERLRLANGTFKTTAVHRLDSTFPLIKRFLNHPEPIQVLDIGVSSAISTVELYEELMTYRKSVDITAIDLYIEATCRGQLNAHVLEDPQGYPLAFGIFGRIQMMQTRRLKAALGLRVVKNLIFHAIRNMSSAKRSVRMLSRKAIQHPAIKAFEWDLFNISTLEARYDFVRAANVLNSNYFSDEKICIAVKEIFHTLNDQGFLLVVRTMGDGSNHGTLFQKRASTFTVCESIGNGYEKLNLILDVQA